MRTRIGFALVFIGLALGACGGAGTETETTTSLDAPSTSSPTTVVTDSPTTTFQETTTTAEPGTQNGEAVSLMASLQESNATLTSGRIEGSIEITGMDEASTGLSVITILFNTAFDAATGNASLALDMSSLADSIDAGGLDDSENPFAAMTAGFLGEMEFRQIDERVYLKFPFFTAMFGAETDWISMPAEEGDEFTNTFDTVPSDPSEVLEAYEGAATTVEDLGTESVNGIEATHYRITLDAEEMDLTQEERAELEETGLFAEGVIPMDIWVSEEGYTVRMVLEIDGSGMDAPREEQFETMTIRYDLSEINAEIVIEPPPASEVTDFEDLEDGLFGGLDSEG